MSDVDFARQLIGMDPLPIIRIGEVTAVDSGPPVRVTVDDREMRCLASYTTPTSGDVIVWLEHMNRRIALGPQL